MAPNRLTLILATVGRTSELGRAFRSFATQSCRDFDVVVVDQNQDDRLVPIIEDARDLGVSVMHIRMQERGLAKARNVGLEHASGEYVAFPDDDCWYETDAIKSLVEALDIRSYIGGFVGRWVEQAHGRERERYRLSLADWRGFRGGDAASIVLFLNRAAVNSVGGFDPRLGVGQWYGAGEETDLILRLLAAGCELWHEPAIRVHHHFSSVPIGDVAALCRSARCRGRGTGALYAKHALAWGVVARGLVAPVVKPIFQRTPCAEWRRGVATSIGRIEGFLTWRWRDCFKRC